MYEDNLSVNVKKDLKFLEDALKSNNSGYLHGKDITLADIMVAFSAQFVLARGLGAKWENDDYPNIKDWIVRLRKRDGWQRAVQRGEDSYTIDALTP